MSANPVAVTSESEHTLSQEARLVRDSLLTLGLETPMLATGLHTRQKYERIRDLMTPIVPPPGLDLNHDSLTETPHRIAKMYVEEIFRGLDYAQFPKMSLIDNKLGDDEMIKVRDIAPIRTCEHHFVTNDGAANVASLPG